MLPGALPVSLLSLLSIPEVADFHGGSPVLPVNLRRWRSRPHEVAENFRNLSDETSTIGS
jgi:hypothetical protein